MISIIYLFIPILLASAVPTSDVLSTRIKALEQVFIVFYCKPSCRFNETQLNSVTIKSFPKCKEVCGIIFIDSETDLTVEQMKKAFEKMRTLKGGFNIENTSLTSLSVFTADKEKGNFNVVCDVYGVYIRNNSQLNDPSVLYDLYLYRDRGIEACDIRIENNPKLEFSCDGGFLHMYNELIVRGNLKDCGCDGEKVNVSNVKEYSKCKTLDSGLNLVNINATFDYDSFLNVTMIRGSIAIRNTNLQSLSFLQNLQTIEYNSDIASVALNVQDNPEMIRLGLPILTKVIDTVEQTSMIQYSTYNKRQYFNFENLHPDFCVTITEIVALLNLGISTENIEAKLCKDPGPLDASFYCTFESMSKLSDTCMYILGDLLIDHEDEKYVSKLGVLQFLFGTLTIRNTNLTDLNFLDQMTYIGALNGNVTYFPVIQIYSNPNLRNVGLNGIMNIITKGNRTAIIQDNHPDLFKSTPCQLFGAYFSNPAMENRVNLTYIGSNCGERVHITSSQSGRISIGLSFSLFVLFWSFKSN
ncbi:Receptor L-domain domain-containing protein [Caenorhabditis elegans]|uniref:Receptor L-domain domain-containing protein n=1 Tax=Caenorhabditis elegans TaxID=6239 RepID=G5EED3_CAEEL|nr:Receptor L-domain domain-containing protein [Caenorhabditis elegans]CAB07716.3 Receptor L-domain domain-containing protein [Caenorhabditis elegans]|eukprot:NP_499656.2 Insulin/EGF-Receptor L Domain protein [Caenorhabditis elegans]